MINRRILGLLLGYWIERGNYFREGVLVCCREALQRLRQTTLGESKIIAMRREQSLRLALDQSSKSVRLIEINLPDESIGFEIGAVIGEIQAGHGIQVVGSLKIAEGEWTRQIRRHSHGIEALHGEGRSNGGEVTMPREE